MGRVKGQLEHKRFKEGKKLTRKQAILAMCYECNGLEDSNCDCQGKNCPLYRFQPYSSFIDAGEAHFAIDRIKRNKPAISQKGDGSISEGGE